MLRRIISFSSIFLCLGILTQIEEDGKVNGICQGTGTGENLAFYLNRKTRKHDPRGIGAVVTAGMEISKMKQLTN
jgi:rhamnogalacturonyl hydrolase YesR